MPRRRNGSSTPIPATSVIWSSTSVHEAPPTTSPSTRAATARPSQRSISSSDGGASPNAAIWARSSPATSGEPLLTTTISAGLSSATGASVAISRSSSSTS
jgi:hypothetical protein